MKKLLALILVTTSLTGCVYQTVNQYDIQRAIIICGSLDKVVEISAHHLGMESVLCTTGLERNLNQRYQRII